MPTCDALEKVIAAKKDALATLRRARELPTTILENEHRIARLRKELIFIHAQIHAAEHSDIGRNQHLKEVLQRALGFRIEQRRCVERLAKLLDIPYSHAPTPSSLKLDDPVEALIESIIPTRSPDQSQ
ncbi:hypothetical protein GMRT_11833 [Giardia muris]|uniref:Uncharacterized protein n=1 Tax=Giardia muris TaxID=5742 RepID=A0A4Z1T4R8_GIAMU|nr:hypothetical protein GMRT_11833 [Giardia muris]|eukprot:TNJ28993.1 hypothetical protein GMRT_11833 [Giardia muris]